MTFARRALLAAGAVGAAVAFVLTGASPAFAHAVVVSSTPSDGQVLPTAPNQVQITFSEHVSAELGGLTVLNSSGERVDSDDSSVGGNGDVLSVSLKPDLPDGTYVMNYRVISADGHPVGGAIVFGVGDQTVIDSSGVQNLQAGRDPGFEFAAGVARFVTYVGALLAAGLAVFVTFVHDQRPDRWRLTPIVRISAVVGAIGAFAVVAIQAALATERGFSAMTDLTTLRQALTEGLDWQTVVLLLGLALVHVSTDMTKPVVAQSLAFYGALITAASFAFWGHSTTVEPGWLGFTVDFVHVATAAVWLGGLVGLSVTLWGRRRTPTTDEQNVEVAVPVGAVVTGSERTGSLATVPEAPPEPPTGDGDWPLPDDEDDVGIAASTARMVARFSTLAGACLALLVVAGGVLAWKELETFSALGSSSYGRALLIKIFIVLVILLVASYNRWRLLPEIEEEEQEEAEQGASSTLESSAWQRLNRSLAAEIIGIVAVLGVTSVLVNLTPPRSAQYQTAVNTVGRKPVRDSNAEVQLTPSAVGSNEVHVYYYDANYQPADIAQQVSVEMSEPDKGIGPIARDADKSGPGHFTASDFQVPTSGTWNLTLVTRLSEFDQERTEFTFTVTP
jgi:copper transport protein